MLRKLSRLVLLWWYRRILCRDTFIGISKRHTLWRKRLHRALKREERRCTSGLFLRVFLPRIFKRREETVPAKRSQPSVDLPIPELALEMYGISYCGIENTPEAQDQWRKRHEVCRQLEIGAYAKPAATT